MGILCCCFRKNGYYDIDGDEYGGGGGSSESRRILDHNAVGINDAYGDRDNHYYNQSSNIAGGQMGPNGSWVPGPGGLNGGGGYGSIHNQQQLLNQQNPHHQNQYLSSQSARQAFENSQSQLYNNVLDRLSSRVIDISSIEKSGEQADLTDREKAIYDKLSFVRKTVALNSNYSGQFPRTEYCHKTIEPIPLDDYRLIQDFAMKTLTAVEYGFRINATKKFVVDFNDPIE